VDAVVDLFTADAAIMAASLPTAVGRAQIIDTYSSVLAAVSVDATIDFDWVEVTGDTAVARTRSNGTMTVRSTGETSAERDRELIVLRRGEAGWRISAYMLQPQPEAA
jgi:ketosteroid isomerase-like protein